MAEIIKTTISLERGLHDEVQGAAKRLGRSGNDIVVLALKESLRRDENRRLLEQINAACDVDPEETELLRRHKQMWCRLIADEW